ERLLADVQHADLQARAGLGVHDEVVEPPPRALELLELLVVHDRGELLRDGAVDGLDRLVEGGGQALVPLHRALEGLRRQRLQQLLGARALGLLGRADRLLEQARAFRRLGSGLALLLALAAAHAPPPSAGFASAAPTCEASFARSSEFLSTRSSSDSS